MPTDDDMLTPAEAAQFIRCGRRTLQDWRSRGGGPPYIRTGSQTILYRRGDVIAWLRARTVTSTSAEAAAARPAGARVVQLRPTPPDAGEGASA